MVRIFSLKRVLLSAVLGFLVPLSYAFVLSEALDYTGKTAPDFLVMPFGWPRPLWIVLMRRQPSEGDLIALLIFVAIGNIVLYGTLIYTALLIISASRSKRVNHEPPPPPAT